ncbi:MAG: aldo/keto reductase [Candidatus Heimdallarchaeota archaeon]
MSKLNLPKIGLGTMMGNSNIAKEAFIAGIQMGFRFLDTAQMYLNESTVGNAIRESGVSRDEIILATKLWVTNMSPNRVIKSAERSIKRLGLDHIDVLYIHWPVRFKKIEETLSAMSKLVDQEKINHIAVSNFEPEHITKALEVCDKPIVANQVEMHPWLQQKELREFLNKKNIKLVSYFPLLHGRFKIVPEIVELAEKYQVSGAQVSLAWAMSKGVIPIPKSANVKHLEDNYNSLQLKLDKKDIQVIDSITKVKRFLKPPILTPSSW